MRKHISPAVTLVRTWAIWHGSRHRVGGPAIVSGNTPLPSHSSQRSNTKQAFPHCSPLLPAERWVSAGKQNGRLWTRWVSYLAARPLPPALYPGAKASTVPDSVLPEAKGQTREERRGQRSYVLPSVDGILLGLLRYIRSVPRGSSLTVTGGRSSELNELLFPDLKGNSQRNIK